MAYFEWTRDLDTGISVIDNQHIRIADYINALHDAIKSDDQEVIREVLYETVDYTLTHFAFEESLMEEAGYTYLKVHKRVHAIFTKKVEAYVERFEKGELIADELLSTLRLWVMNHIRNDDAHYVSTVKAVVGEESKKGWLAGALKKFFG